MLIQNDKLLIIGAGGHGKVIADIAASLRRYNYIAFLDDNEKLTTALGYNILGKTEGAFRYIDEYDFFVAIGDSSTRKKFIENLISTGAHITTLIHPSAIIGSQVQIGIGTVIMAGVTINCSTQIGIGCILNTKCSVDHDCKIEDYVHLSPGAVLSGRVSVGRETWLCMSSAICNGVNICADSIIGAGCVVIRDINEPGTYVGVPAKKIK